MPYKQIKIFGYDEETKINDFIKPLSLKNDLIAIECKKEHIVIYYYCNF